MTQNTDLKSVLKKRQTEYGYICIVSALVASAGIIVGIAFPQNTDSTPAITLSFALMIIAWASASLFTIYRDLQQIIPESKEVSE